MMNTWIVSGKTPAHRSAPDILFTLHGKNRKGPGAARGDLQEHKTSTILAGGGVVLGDLF